MESLNKVIVASDSFKGSLASWEVAEAVSEAVRELFPKCSIVGLSVADGGEGTTEALCKAFSGQMQTVCVKGPLGDPVEAQYCLADYKGNRMAVIEMSQASGLYLIPSEKRNPWYTSTYGTGEIIADALDKGCRSFLIGIGGSATNDAGTGVLSALGWRFLGRDGKELPPIGGSLSDIVSIDEINVRKELKECTFQVACDVDTPFCGPDGAAPVFAPQKGADSGMVSRLDKGMQAFADLIKSHTGKDIARMSGAGAAGGLGGGLHAFLGATLLRGAEMVLSAIGFDEKAKGADLVITGEGRIDYQTDRGKTPCCVLQHATALGIPTIAIAGSAATGEEACRLPYQAILPVTPPTMPLEVAMRRDVAFRNIYLTVKQYLQNYD